MKIELVMMVNGLCECMGCIIGCAQHHKDFWFDILMNHVFEKDSYRTRKYNSWTPMYLSTWISFYMVSIISLMQIQKRKAQSDDSFPIGMIRGH